MAKSLSKTPAPKKDRIYGSKVNPKGSASSEKSAKDIQLSTKITLALMNKLKEFKETHKTKKVSLSDLKAVYRRGLGAYSTSHRPNIPRNAWAMARVNAFLRKAGGGEYKEAYVQDDDLLKMHLGGDMSKHLAPNGKPSNLTHEQWHLVRTPEFKAWFGDWENNPENASKVVDENGEPLVVYHGSNSDFNVFKKSEKNPYADVQGYFFAYNKKYAESYNSKYVKPYFLNLRIEGSYDDDDNLFPKNADGVIIEGLQVQVFDNKNIKLADGTNTTFDESNDIRFADGGEVDAHKETYKKWKSLVNMSYSELNKFYNSKEGKEAGLSSSEANEQGISSGRESARWIMKMKSTPVSKWTDTMWKWANKQISFISRMSGMKGGLYDDKGNKTRKHTSLLIWGNNPKKSLNMSYETGGVMDVRMEDTVQRMDNPHFADISYYDYGGELKKLGLSESEVEKWQKEHKVNQRQVQNPKVMESATLLSEGKISQEEYLKIVKENQPIKPFTKVPQIPTLLEMVGALQENQIDIGIIGYTKFIEDGEMVATRLDIPAYNNYDTWIVSVHDANEKNSIGYGQTAYLKDITFITSPKVALRIATDKQNKSTFARMKGSWVNKYPNEVRDMAIKYTNDKNWVQVGMNPFRHSWFYDKSDGMPLLSADEVIQVGALVLAKNPVKTTPDNPIFIADKNNPSIKFEQGGEFKSHKTIEQIAKEKNVPLQYAIQQLNKGIKVESEHSNSKEVQQTIALQHLDEMIDYYERLETIENKNGTYMKNGGNLKYDSANVKEYFAHGSGNAGGVLVGKRHSEGGIKAINKSTGQPLEMEGGEVVITRNAVSDNSKREFEGEMLTNREILSKINQSGGGVKIFSEGGDIESHTCSCSGKSYKYGGKMMSDYDIAMDMSKHDKQHRYSMLSDKTYASGGTLDVHSLNPTEMMVLHKLDGKIHAKCDISRSKLDEISNLEKMGIVYTTQTKDHTCYHVRLTDYGIELLKNTDIPAGHFAKGGSTADCGCGKSYKNGGGTDEAKTYFKGIDAKYKNQFEINKAIEELISSVPVDKITAEEKNFISYFSGYGGLEKYGATGKGLLYEYFTPSEIAKKMWGLAYKYGYKGGRVLEPACGIGEFIKYAPEQSLVTGYEINEVSAKICEILYPNANIQSKYFETLFIKNNNTMKDKTQSLQKYELVIGNPPYGSMGGIYAGMGEKQFTKASNYIDYFISRGLDLLEKDGLLIYIIGTEVAVGGTPMLMQGMTPVKKSIFEKADLIDAYRLPNGLFDTTDVVTDIVVFKKK